VKRQYGCARRGADRRCGLVREGCEAALELARDPAGAWLQAADAMLAQMSWDRTQAAMAALDWRSTP
jgi:hypothetical protein